MTDARRKTISPGDECVLTHECSALETLRFSDITRSESILGNANALLSHERILFLLCPPVLAPLSRPLRHTSVLLCPLLTSLTLLLRTLPQDLMSSQHCTKLTRDKSQTKTPNSSRTRVTRTKYFSSKTVTPEGVTTIERTKYRSIHTSEPASSRWCTIQ